MKKEEMNMKKSLICILAVFALLLAACGQQEAPAMETEPDREIDICLSDYYGMVGVMSADMDGNMEYCEFNAISVLGAPGEIILDRFTSNGFSEIAPVLEGDSFEGWMECRYDDELGHYVIVSETLYTTEELMAMPVPGESVEYVAKWAGIPVEEYFVSDPFEGASSSGVFNLSANGGSMGFRTSDGSEYTSGIYGYTLEEGASLNDVMGTEFNDTLVDISKEGAAFTGWTVYMAEDLFLSHEIVEEEDMLCLVFDENGYEGVVYALLRNAALVDENMSTEDLCGITCNGENYLAMANWESSAGNAAHTIPSVFAFSANGGSIHLHNYADEEYKTVTYAYGLEYGQALNDVMGTEYGDALIGMSKDSAEFLGWTLYVADEITWSKDEVYDTEILCLPYNDAGSHGMDYALLTNGSLVGEYMPTEQLCGMTAYGENYLAIAIWSE